MEKGQLKEQDRCQAFINYVITRMEKDRAMGARLRRADNPATEYQSWEYLVPFRVNLLYENERRAFATVAAALARAKPKTDGTLGLGRAIALSFEDGRESEQAKARLRRILACKSGEEACDILRNLLRLIESKGKTICYAHVLRDLLFFSEKIKEQWAQDFYSLASTEPTEEV